MFVELHLLQNFAPSNLNRDDTGAPKDCEFGGYRRARISSQSLKRAIRTTFGSEDSLTAEYLAQRTKRILDRIAASLEADGRPAERARSVAQAALAAIDLRVGADGKTEYLLFVGARETDALAALCSKYWDPLSTAGQQLIEQRTQRVLDKKPPPSKEDETRLVVKALPPEAPKALSAALDGGRAADLALFGRMLADLPERNVDAAAQVAHAISTNRVATEFDFYTAVDDLRPEDTAGADMLGTVEFNSACFYRYANVDLEQLKANLGGDEDLAQRTIDAFLRASIAAIPTGKQNSFAAQNPPSFVMAVARRSGLWSLANAFLRPIRPDDGGDLVEKSVAALDQYWGELTSMYGEGSIAGAWCAALDASGLNHLKDYHEPNLAALLAAVAGALDFAEGVRTR